MSPKLLNLLLVILPFVLYYGYIDPMYNGTPGLAWTFENTIPVLKAKNVQYENSIGQIDLIQRSADNLNKDYKAIDPKVIEKLNTLLPSSVDPIKLRNDVVSIAAKSGVAITNLVVELDPRDQNVYKINFNIKARYSLFKMFMADYEKSTRMFVLTGMRISRIEASGVNDKDVQNDISADKLNISVSSKVYFKK